MPAKGPSTTKTSVGYYHPWEPGLRVLLFLPEANAEIERNFFGGKHANINRVLGERMGKESYSRGTTRRVRQ